MTLSPITAALMAPLSDGRKELALLDHELLKLCESAQQHAGNQELAQELLAVAVKLHDGGAELARDQAIMVAAVVLEDRELNGALCRRLYAGRRDMSTVVGHPMTARTAPTAAPDPAKSALATRLASLAGVKTGG
ncbi:MAG TPA: hypothetical protein VGO62_03760 [Myxococcota bacterium]